MRSQEATYGEARWSMADGTAVYDLPLAVEYAAQLPRKVALPAVLNLVETWYVGENGLNRLRLLGGTARRAAGRLWLALDNSRQPHRAVLRAGLLGAVVLEEADGVGLWRLAGSV